MSDFTKADILRTSEVLEAIAEDRTLLALLDSDQRVAFLTAAGRVSRPTRHEVQRVSKAFRRIEKKKRNDHDRDLRGATEIRTARLSDVFIPPARLVSAEDAPAEVGELVTPRNCYICKSEFRRVHFFYDALCAPCAALNYEKRFQTASLVGRVALITGARVKIGFQAALMMLRAGASVIVTTRFPRDAASRYAREPDFDAFKDRLEIHGLDLRHAPSVELFSQWLVRTRDRLDILINNAAQTVRRPSGFYKHLIDHEIQPFEALSEPVQHLLSGHEACKSAITQGAAHGVDLASRRDESGVVSWHGSEPGVGIRSAALMSQLHSVYDDGQHGAEVFPVGRADADLQQVDLRTINSWRLTLADVPTPEMLEVHLVNAVAPFILASKLKPLMLRFATGEKHIVNVSAMEGQFARHTKTDKHPHTNMAKAALNMMTLTSAPDYAASGIFMNAVDTGWVTDEDPAQIAARKQRVHDFQPPLDIVDGAARICDPFFSGLITGNHVFGKFLKDYRPTSW